MNEFLNLFQSGIFSSENLSELLKYAIGVSIIFAFLFLCYFILNRVVKRIEKRTEVEIIPKFRKELKIPIIILIFIISLWFPLTFTHFPDFISVIVNKVLSILIIVVISWISIRLIKLFKHFILSKYDIEQKDNLKARKVYTQFKIIERILVFIIIIISVSLALMTFSEIREIGLSIIASAGVTGIILGFAAQKVIGGVLAGFQIAITQPIRLDDVVIVENEWGRIEEITLTYVVVKIWDERRLVLPTTYFIEHPFQNWTRTNSDILGTVFIYTDYKVPFDEIRKELTRLLKSSEYWDGKVDVLQVTDSNEKTVEIRALMSSSDSSAAWNLRVFVREQLIKFIQENYPDSLPKSRLELSKKEQE